MKSLIITLVSLSLYANFAAAEDHPLAPKKEVDFKTRKENELNMLKIRIEGLTKLQSCITEAKTNEAIIECHSKNRPMARPPGARGSRRGERGGMGMPGMMQTPPSDQPSGTTPEVKK